VLLVFLTLVRESASTPYRDLGVRNRRHETARGGIVSHVRTRSCCVLIVLWDGYNTFIQRYRSANTSFERTRKYINAVSFLPSPTDNDNRILPQTFWFFLWISGCLIVSAFTYHRGVSSVDAFVDHTTSSYRRLHIASHELTTPPFSYLLFRSRPRPHPSLFDYESS
jgi:hypothetical protein